MTPAQFLDIVIPKWQQSLPPKYTPALIARFVESSRKDLEALVGEAFALRRAQQGKAPRDAAEWRAYANLLDQGRERDAEPDAKIIRRIQTRMDRLAAKLGDDADARAAAWDMGIEYVQQRAQAILMGARGWDAVPLLLRRPATLIVSRQGKILCLYGADAETHMVPNIAAEKLRVDLGETRKQLGEVAAFSQQPQLERWALGVWAMARSRVAAASPPVAPPIEAPPDLREKPWRTEANLAAMQLVLTKEPGEFAAEELQKLAQYSGWGGLSIEAVAGRVPAEIVPETFGLIHEYYTPSVIADALAETLCPLLAELAGNDGIVRALEPSAGIGRLVRAFSPRHCLALEAGGQIRKIEWTAVEFSKVSARLLRALRPDVDLYHMPFERWIRAESPRFHGTISLVVSNPPYGERGAMAREDPDEQYKEKRAYAYFMRRALDLLVPGGIGVFLVPAGFLSGNLNRALREKILRRHHLLGAFRLPSHDRKGRENVPGASVVMDMVFWRSRGGELAEIDEGDRYIADGDYFARHKDHLLGVEDGSFSGDDEVGKARSWRYRVTGDLPTKLPPLTPRPVCTACILNVIAPRETAVFQTVARADDGVPDDVDDELRHALDLGARVGRYLAALGADEAERAALLWPELNAALRDFAASFGNPARSAGLRKLADKRGIPAAQQILGAFDRNGTLTPALGQPPGIAPKFSGQPDDVIAQAEALFRQQRSLTVAQLLDFHAKQGGTRSRDDALAVLFAAEWNLDGPAWDQLYPKDAYLTGNELWDRHDRAQARAARGDEQARVQVRRLIDAIKPAVFEDLGDIDPRHGYVPLDLVGGWLSETLNANYGRIELEREGGFVQIRGHDYVDADLPPVAPDVLNFLGYYNHDPELFKPAQERRDRSSAPMTREERAAAKQNLAERRIALARKWSESFVKWIAADRDRREALVYAYNRVARGRIVPTYTAEPLEIARWGAGAPKLRAHQIAGARRVLDARGGLIAFDVGVGKTYTALAIIARARQEGWVRRPVILVPGSLVWKWHDDILCTLPDYRVLVIGSKRKRISRGDRKGLLTSETDTPQERAQKWQALQSGQVDVVVLSMDALGRTRMNEAAVLGYIEQVEAVQRSIALRRRALEEANQSEKARSKLSERERALLEHGVKAWVDEILALPNDWTYDPGVAWDEIGVDMLVVDEAAAFKNLHKPQAREDGVPKFMGGGGEGSDRAWQLDFRAAAVRKYTGGAGIVLLTATPAKNSPLEFYNLIQFIDPTAFTRAGIRDPEQFIDRFLKIEYRDVLDSTFEITRKSAVTGFKNLEDLRTIIFRYGEFRTGAEVGLKLPRPIVETLTIQMDEVQESKYARYVAQIEQIISNPNPEGGQSNVILGLLARLSLIALHGALEEGYDYRSALEGGVAERRKYDSDGEVEVVKIRLSRPSYASPKLTECARRVAASPHCGHIIFCEPTAVHLWMREVLVSQGIPRERIAILNAVETKPADRIRIAREFNGLSSEPPAPGTCSGPSTTTTTPKFDVVIANSVAYEGIDLQVRTCTIHHLDLPWTPADLEQRNGRAVRQGNTLGTVQIFYYFADGSTDGYRFSLIDGKATWLGDLIKSQVRDTNNPAAQQSLTPEDILLMISRDKDKTRALLEDKKRRQAEEARTRIAREATRILRQAAGRFRDARVSDDPERAARLREEGEQRLADLERVNPEAWPWAHWMYPVRDREVIIPDTGPAVYEGLRVARPRVGAPDQIDYLEFGQIVDTDEGARIGLRAAGSPAWQLINYTGEVGGVPLLAEHFPREGGPAWPEDDDARTAAALEKKIPEVFRFGRYEQLRWRGASDAWLEKWWPRFDAALVDGLVGDGQVVPVEGPEGLMVASGDEVRRGKVLPPTRAGWQRFLELAPASGEKFTRLKELGQSWWERTIPFDLLASRTEESGTDARPPRHDPEEERMGELLRRGRDEEEARWAAAVERGTAIEHARGLAPEEARKAVIKHLATDIHHYDGVDVRSAPEPPQQPKSGQSSLYEEARAAIRSIDLPKAKQAQYLRQAEAAIADGKSYLPVVTRARKAAEKLRPSSPASGAPTRVAVERSELDAMLNSFNGEPGYRLASQRQGGNSETYVIYPEGKDADAAVAAIDVVGYEVDDVRWLDDRVSSIDRDTILERMDRALWAANDADSDAESRSPLQDLTEMMERLVRSRGVDVEASKNPGRPDGYTEIAEALAQLAEPAEMDALQLEVWLESTGYLFKAAEIVAGARGPDVKVPDLMRRLWREILIAVPVTTISAGPTPGTLRVPDNALHRGDPVTVLERRIRNGRATLRQIVVNVRGKDTTPRWSIVSDPTERLEPGSVVHDTNYPDEWLHQIYRNINAFEDHLAEAPKRLADVRTLLYWTAAMLDAPLCQGEVKRRATEALQQARTYYEAARRQLIDGQTVDAARRIHEALRRIGTAAAELARSCGDGQTVLPGAAPSFAVSPTDQAALAGASMSLPRSVTAPTEPGRAAMRPSALSGPATMSGDKQSDSRSFGDSLNEHFSRQLPAPPTERPQAESVAAKALEVHREADVEDVDSADSTSFGGPQRAENVAQGPSAREGGDDDVG